MSLRSRGHLFAVAAARLEQDHGNPKVIADLLTVARSESQRLVDGRGFDEAEKVRVERQRTLFTMLPVYAAVDRLKEAVMQRAYDLMWDGATDACDALLEFLPEADAEVVLSSWEADTTAIGDVPRSRFYGGAP